MVKTAFASVAAASFRILLMPIDTVKTIMQVEGKEGLSVLGKKLRAGGPPVLFYGALATASATMVGHYPWFVTYNVLDEKIPKPETLTQKLLRQALIGGRGGAAGVCLTTAQASPPPQCRTQPRTAFASLRPPSRRAARSSPTLRR